MDSAMRKYIRRVVSLIMLLAWTCTVTAFAADTPTVTYDSAKGIFTFQNLDNDGLFGAFQDLMPGDERTTEIRIEMKNLSRSARLYLRAEPNSEDVEVLKTLKLSVKQSGATLDESNGATSLNQNVLLGTFSGDSTTVLDVTLTVPVTVGNEMARQTGELQWIFTVQEDGDDPIVVAVPPPQTGDDSHIGLYVTVMLISGIAFCILLFLTKRKRREN